MIRRHTLCALSILFLTTLTRAAGAEELVEIGRAYVPAGTGTQFPVRFYSNSIIPLTSAVQIDIRYDSENTPIPADSQGGPDCTANPDTGKDDTRFAFLPSGCTGKECTSIRAIVESANDSSPIPQIAEGIDLFTCNIQPPFGTPRGGYQLTLELVTGSDELGKTVSLSANDGWVSVYDPTPGDCDGNGVVPVSEIVRAVTDALGTAPVACEAADLNRDGEVDVSELLTVVSTALSCDPSTACWFHA